MVVDVNDVDFFHLAPSHALAVQLADAVGRQIGYLYAQLVGAGFQRAFRVENVGQAPGATYELPVDVDASRLAHVAQMDAPVAGCLAPAETEVGGVNARAHGDARLFTEMLPSLQCVQLESGLHGGRLVGERQRPWPADDLALAVGVVMAKGEGGREGLAEELQDHRLAAAQTDGHLPPVHPGPAHLAVEGIEPQGIPEWYGQAHFGCHDVGGGEVGHEVMVAGGVLTADGLQAQLGLQGFGRGRARHLGGVNAADDVGALLPQLLDVLLHGWGHEAAAGDDEPSVGGAAAGDELPVGTAGGQQQQALGDVVAVEACMVDVEDGLAELGHQPAHGVDGELHEQLARGLAPCVAHGQQHQEVVVGLSPLQEALAALHVLHEEGGVAPDAVGGAHVDGGIELPPWPRVVAGAVARAVEEHVVHARAEHEVEVGLQL